MDRKEMLRKTALLPLAAWADRGEPRPKHADPDVPFNDRRDGDRVWDCGVSVPPKGERIVVVSDDGETMDRVKVINWDAPYIEHYRTDEAGRALPELVERRIAFTVRWSDGKVYRSAAAPREEG